MWMTHSFKNVKWSYFLFDQCEEKDSTCVSVSCLKKKKKWEQKHLKVRMKEGDINKSENIPKPFKSFSCGNPLIQCRIF